MLDDLFARLRRDAFGGHRIERAGRGGEREETTKPYEFGDPFHLDLRATLANALMREENAPAAPAAAGDAVRLRPDDFEVFRTEQTDVRTSTVLLVDMSRSMLLRGCFLAAKKVAIALDTLIRTQFPRDHLSIIGFAYYAREIRPEALAELAWHGYEYGTNLQHGLLLARRILARQHAANREIVVITDGEPTAHFEHGQVEFNYPPTRRTIQETLARSQRCTKEGITINTFMLERSRALDRLRGARDPAQPGPSLLRHPGAPRRVRACRFRLTADEARVVGFLAGPPSASRRTGGPNAHQIADAPLVPVPSRAWRDRGLRADLRLSDHRERGRPGAAARPTSPLGRPTPSSDRLVSPLALTIPGITGVAMILVTGIDLSARTFGGWGSRIVLYVIAITIALTVQPPAPRIISLTVGRRPPREAARRGAPGPRAQLQRGGMINSVLIVAIVLLMVVKPQF